MTNQLGFGGIMRLQRLGGLAALAAMCLGIVYLFLATSVSLDSSDLAKIMAAVSAAPAIYKALNILVILSYFLLLPLVVALHERMKADVPNLALIILMAQAVGSAMTIAECMVYLKAFHDIIPINDLSAYRACVTIASSLGSLGGLACGWSALLIGCAILKTRLFPKFLGWLYVASGIAVILGFMPFPRLGDIIHSLVIPATIWIGIALLRQKLPQRASNETAVAR
jgi:hypothetical protein